MSQLTDVAEELVALGAVSRLDLAQPAPNAKRVLRRDANALHRASGGARPYAAGAAGSESPGRRCARGKDSNYQRPATPGGGRRARLRSRPRYALRTPGCSKRRRSGNWSVKSCAGTAIY